ncbi:unnamed protein product [Linum tenue]|uniref:Uncharacterized protein n=1 Tax=Linum tenue TaxID=586396 RepID=A0AAV0QZJ8_9ROSI|nr:unnamed protein product [Linum tenue]
MELVTKEECCSNQLRSRKVGLQRGCLCFSFYHF